MKPTTREQVTVTLLVDLEYETQEGRDRMIYLLKDCIPKSVRISSLIDGWDHYRIMCDDGSVTVSSNDESAIIVTEAPQFTWNSQLLPGNVYSLEHAEAVNKK